LDENNSLTTTSLLDETTRHKAIRALSVICIQKFVACSLGTEEKDTLNFHPIMKDCLKAYIIENFSVVQNISTSIRCINFLFSQRKKYSIYKHFPSANESLLEIFDKVKPLTKKDDERIHYLRFKQLPILIYIMMSHHSLNRIYCLFDYLEWAKDLIQTNEASQEINQWPWATEWKAEKAKLCAIEKEIRKDYPQVEDKKMAFLMGLEKSSKNESQVQQLSSNVIGEKKLVKEIFSYLFKPSPKKDNKEHIEPRMLKRR
jgi:hypothetical protein